MSAEPQPGAPNRSASGLSRGVPVAETPYQALVSTAETQGRMDDVDEALVRTIAQVGVAVSDQVATVAEDVARIAESVERIEESLYDEPEEAQQ